MTAIEPRSAPPTPVGVTPQPCPRGMVPTSFEHDFEVEADRERVWNWLVDPATFTDSQLPPWRVEFLDPTTGEPAGFEEGVVTNHHGPLTNFSGVITTVDDAHYRDLHYGYGAFFLSPRICRPTRLQFRVEDTPTGGTVVRLRVDAHVTHRLVSISQRFQAVFWRRFEGWLTRGVT